MATATQHDSELSFDLSPTAEPERLVPISAIPAAGGGADDESPTIDEPIAYFDLLSDGPLPDFDALPPVRPAHAVEAPPPPPGEEVLGDESSMWLDGDVLMCACPDCRAPMTVRIWLMVADCWNCGASIELTEEQEREARRLLDEREARRRKAANRQEKNGKSAAPSVSVAPSPARKEPAAKTAPPSPARERGRSSPAPPPPLPLARGEPRRPVSAAPQRRQAEGSVARDRMRKMARRGAAGVWLEEALKLTPAWLISLVFHLVLILLLWLIALSTGEERMVVAVTVSRDHETEDTVVDPTDDTEFDLPVPKDVDLKDPSKLESIQKADQEAKEIRLDPYHQDPQLPDVHRVRQQISSANGTAVAYAARDPRVRIEMVKKEGGTTLTEAAVARALRWMARQQNEDGSWSLHKHGGIRSNSAGTSLVLLPFLGAGQNHLTPGPYQQTVAKGLRWLVDHQAESGDLRAGSSGNSGMYAHGQAAIVLCEAFAMTGDEKLRSPAQKAIDFIVDAQYNDGGWRYTPYNGPNDRGDTSVVGWQLMALQSARVAGLDVPEETLQLADQYLDGVESIKTNRPHMGATLYSYMGRRNPTHVMTAEALLCRMYLGARLDEPGLKQAIDWLNDAHPPAANQSNMYYWYYATQAMHHAGGDAWDRWNEKMSTLLINTQVPAGNQAGSWTPSHSHDKSGGRLYMTALAACTLEVYYRHLPIFRQIDLE